MARSQSPSRVVVGKGVCVAADREAAEAGASILRAGGNAFDAAVAAGFTEAVISPSNCGIGGYGGAMVGFVAKSGTPVALDANSTAPAASRPDMFPVIPSRDPNNYKFPDAKHRLGALSVGVPGVLAGLLTILERWGRLDRSAVMLPAIEKLRQGVALTPGQARTWLNLEAEAQGREPPARSATPPKVLPMPDLRNTFETIRAEGPSVFYQGRIGQAIVEDVRRRGGILSQSDMADYRATPVEPVALEVNGHRLFAAPPAAGGLTCLQMVALFHRFRRGRSPKPGSAEEYEAFLEIGKVAWEDRLTKLADPRFMDSPPASLLADAYLDRLFDRVVEGLANPRKGRIVAPDPLRGTVHLAAADSEGNVVSWTQTHGGGFGANLMAKGLGVVLGHGMCRFEPRPGWANSVAPGKRPLHNMCPVIALKNGKPVLAVGAAGGRTIVNNVAALTISRILDRAEPLDAVARPRLQCETMEPAVLEKSAGPAVPEALRARGREIKETGKDAGVAHLIVASENGWTAVAETRSNTAGAVSA